MYIIISRVDDSTTTFMDTIIAYNCRGQHEYFIFTNIGGTALRMSETIHTI